MGSEIEKLKSKINEIEMEFFNLQIELEVQKNHVERLNELNKLLTSTLDLNEVVMYLLNYLNSILNYDKGTFVLLKEDQFYLTIIEPNEGIFITSEELQKVEEEELIESIKEKKESILILDCSKNNNLSSRKNGSIIGIPIIINNEIIGVVILECDRSDVYTKEEEIIAYGLINQGGMAIENAILFRKINDMAAKDSLTDIYNRRYFFEIATKEYNTFIRYENIISIIMLDIDFFKKINDKYGHLAGDLVLKRVSKKINSLLRNCDYLARYGGEEFIVLAVGSDLDGALFLAERLREAIENEEIIYKNENEEFLINVTASFGVAEFSKDLNLAQIIDKADTFLYEAKESGRNKVVGN